MENDLKEKFQACMVLHSVGDTIGFNGGYWEFNKFKEDIDYNFTNEIVFEFIFLGGINDFDLKDWVASDDTIMHMATARALLHETKYDIDKIGNRLAIEYVKSFENMSGRYPGKWTEQNIKLLEKGMDWKDIPFAPPGMGGGNGAAMRASCIGLLYYKESDLDKLIAVSIESGRITHNSPIGYLGALAVSFMISCAIRKVPYTLWPSQLLELLESGKIEKYLESTRGLKEYKRDKDFFVLMWKKYIYGRFTGKTVRYEKFLLNPAYRTKYYADNFSFPDSSFFFPGIGGHDSLIIAYDAIVDAMVPKESWEKLVIYSCLHAGDSDTTGAIACSLWGAMFGFKGVPDNNYEKLEYKKELLDLGEQLELAVIRV
jgi:ADP-ribosylglycohydrolase